MGALCSWYLASFSSNTCRGSSDSGTRSSPVMSSTHFVFGEQRVRWYWRPLVTCNSRPWQRRMSWSDSKWRLMQAWTVIRSSASTFSSFCNRLMVVGNPSNTNPLMLSGALSLLRSTSSSRSSTSFVGDLCCPPARTPAICRPRGVPWATSAVSRSPGHKCTSPRSALSRRACVPLPLPGPPSRITFTPSSPLPVGGWYASLSALRTSLRMALTSRVPSRLYSRPFAL
mmetsp:Transcript_13045/g.23474  ORF Transcript_13045/g.23474 Transcript_13045/m.23474 type:complete len:228 (+) Transcript_13045:582-1265(+)